MEQGDEVAQYNLAFMYEKGIGVVQDYQQAVFLYSMAAGQGNADAQLNLGGMYDTGEGVDQDYAQAITWWGKAAEKGAPGRAK